jgi:hypothetical protein
MITNCLAEIKRLVYNWKVAKGKETIGTYFGYLTAINEESKVMSDWKFGKLFKLSITSLVGVRESDTVVIDWKSYSVKWVAQRKGWNLNLTSVMLELW